MPTYQYACTNAECGNEFELVQSFTDPAASECPACHGPVRKVFSAVGVVFKGSGFYRTDSRSGNGATSHGSSGNGKAKDSAAKSESGGASSSSTPSTPSSSSSSDSGSSSTSSSKSSAATPA